MGKKIKKGVPQKDKRRPRPNNAESDNPAELLAPVRDRTCPHIMRGIDLGKISAKIASCESIKCEDCRETVMDKRANRKGKHGKKGAGNSTSDSKAIWICLECGNFSCGGAGLPTTPNSHAVRHSKMTRHAFAVHYKNHQQLWCFHCDKLIAADNFEGIDKLVNLLQSGQGAGSPTVDVDDVWSGKGDSDFSVSIPDRKSGYLVKGLLNLGNTCFFNSVMQNLLATNSLREYFYRPDESAGPLTESLRKLFRDTCGDGGIKGVMNPKPVLNSLCANAPQFKGYHQHDSHELLRCFLDSLSTEELTARKSSQADKKSSVKDPTFVDTIFGGQLSSTVTCLECNHSSVIHEPFLDLSLPVPHKKPPPQKNSLPAFEGKKSKLPPKRIPKTRTKIIRDSRPIPVKSGAGQSKVQLAEQVVLFSDDSIDSNLVPVETCLASQELSCAQRPESQESIEVQSTIQALEQLIITPGDSVVSDSIDSRTLATEMGLTPQDLLTARPANQETVEEDGGQSDSLWWMDYIEPGEVDVCWETHDISENQEYLYEDVADISFSVSVETSVMINPVHGLTEASSDNAKNQFSSVEQDISSEDQSEDAKMPISLFVDDKIEISQFDEEQSAVCPLPEDLALKDVDLCHNITSCNEVYPKESNLDIQDPENPVLVKDAEIKEDVSFNVKQDVSTEHLSNDINGLGNPVLVKDAQIKEDVSCNVKQGVSSNVEQDVSIENQSNDEKMSISEFVDDKSAISQLNGELSAVGLLMKDVVQNDADLSHNIALGNDILVKDVETKKDGPSSADPPGGDPEVSSVENRDEKNVFVNVNGVNKNREVPVLMIADEQDSIDIGNFFDEPEVEASDSPSVIIIGDISESDPSEIDDTNAPVSVESCLALFTKKELLSKDEHAWQCEKCSKILREKMNMEKNALEGLANGFEINVKVEEDVAEEPETCDSDSEVKKTVNDKSKGKTSDEDANSEKWKVKRDATKTILINKAPSVLTVHLKRFGHDTRGRLRKLNGHVNFNETIDLNPYMDPRRGNNDTSSLKYRLVGVVEHAGGLTSGHYVAYIRANRSNGHSAWFNISDSYVRECPFDDVLRSEAYLLFYESVKGGA